MRQSRASLASASVERRTGSRKQAHGIEFRGLHRQAGFDVAQALPVGQLGERHGPIMPGERAPRQKIHQLGRKASCRCSPAPPRKPSEKCQIEFKSTPRQIAKTAFKNMPLNTGASDLTGRQCVSLETKKNWPPKSS